MKGVEEIEQFPEEKGSFEIGSSTISQNTLIPIGDTGRFGIECQVIEESRAILESSLSRTSRKRSDAYIF